MPDEPIIDLQSDHYFMGEALRQAARAYEAEETPIGAVIVRAGRIIARAYNQVELLHDATAHAEMLAITQAEFLLRLALGAGIRRFAVFGVQLAAARAPQAEIRLLGALQQKDFVPFIETVKQGGDFVGQSHPTFHFRRNTACDRCG